MKTRDSAALTMLLLVACEKAGPDAATAGPAEPVVVATGAPTEWERHEHIARGAARGACEDDLYRQCQARRGSLHADSPVEPTCTSRSVTHAPQDPTESLEYRCTVPCTGRCGAVEPPPP
jgi:hypothetical protein